MNCMEDKGWARAERATDCAESKRNVTSER